MSRIVNIDGKLSGPEEAKISVFDHGFLFGDSIYETMRTYRRRIFLLDRHLLRLENSARMLRLKLPLSLEEFGGELNRTVVAASNDECYLRLMVTRGVGSIGLDIDLSPQPGYVVIVNRFEGLPSAYYERGVKIAIVSVRRNDLSTLNPKIKSSNLLNNVLAYVEAKEQGAFEGILCNISGYVSEGTGSNIFLVSDGTLLTPSLDSGLLEGVTRDLVIQLAEQEKIPFQERKVTPEELIEAEECFITSTTKGILPVTKTKMPEGEISIPELWDTVYTLDQVVDVDYYIPGCPPQSFQVAATILAVIDILKNGKELPPKGAILGADNKTCCDECPRERKEKKIKEFFRPHEIFPKENECLLDQGILCMGPATRSGCGALCTKANVPCRGCYGAPVGVKDQGAKMISALSSVIDATTPEEVQIIMNKIADPIGSLYRFSLAGSTFRRVQNETVKAD